MADEKSTSSGPQPAARSQQPGDAPAVPRRHPSRIAKLVEIKGAQYVRAAHQSFYGFDVPDQWANDLAAFMNKPGKMPQMLESGNPDIVQEQIKSIYGFPVTREYAVDLIAAAQQNTKGADE